jgi:hypoxanthine phosphoribosyltransferase
MKKLDAYQLVYPREKIAEQIKLVAQEISSWAEKVWQDSHTELLTIPILRGALFFYSDLVRAIPHSMELSAARSWGYQIGKNQVEAEELRMSIEDIPAQGRHVLLVDDICDSGRTLERMKEALLHKGAIQVKTAVLIERQFEKKNFSSDWTAFKYSGAEWFIGYGMDDCEKWRNLPEVYIIKKNPGA